MKTQFFSLKNPKFWVFMFLLFTCLVSAKNRLPEEAKEVLVTLGFIGIAASIVLFVLTTVIWLSSKFDDYYLKGGQQPFNAKNIRKWLLLIFLNPLTWMVLFISCIGSITLGRILSSDARPFLYGICFNGIAASMILLGLTTAYWLGRLIYRQFFLKKVVTL
jgi:hypothetical protein